MWAGERGGWYAADLERVWVGLGGSVYGWDVWAVRGR